MTMLTFPDLETLRLALASGAVPTQVANAPASASIDARGAIHVLPSSKISKAALGELRRLGVVSREGGLEGPFEDVDCWLQLLPLVRDRSESKLSESTPIYFEMEEGQVAGFVGEVLRLGNDRQSCRWLTVGGRLSAMVRVVGPPYFSLLRAIDRLDRDHGPIAYFEQAPGVLVEVGFRHPMADSLAPPSGRILLIREPRNWRTIEAGPFRDIYGMLAFTLPEAPVDLIEGESPGRMAVPLRLARGPEAEAAELWVLRDRAEEQVEALVRNADDRLLSRLAFAVGQAEGGPTVVIRVRPSKQPPPSPIFDAVGYRPYLRLQNLFVPVGSRLHPPLRRDPVARLLASDPSRITWLAPTSDGKFVPESLPDSAFRPLDQWVDYVLDREHRPLEAWVESARFEFEPFACDGDGTDRVGPAPVEKASRTRKEKAPSQPVAPQAPTKGRSGLTSGSRTRSRPDLPKSETNKPDAALIRLRELEAAFLASPAPSEDEGRRLLLLEMGGLNARLDRPADASVCWSMAIWEVEHPPAEVVESWAEATPRPIGDLKALDRLLAYDSPPVEDLRSVAVCLLRQASDGGGWPGLAGRLGRLQHFFERHEARLPTRLAWLAWLSMTRLSGGDVLALARARDRLLERLHQGGLRTDLDLPGFLRHGVGASADRIRLIHGHLLTLRDQVLDWSRRGHMVAPNTGVLADLVFAFGLGRLGDRDLATRLLENARQVTKGRDAVMILLFQAFEHRIGQALEGRPNVGPLSQELMRRLDRMGKEGGEKDQKKEKEDRYKIDRLREHSRILEPLERINPYRHWVGAQAEELIRELGAWPDVIDRGELASRVSKALTAKRQGNDAAVLRARVLREALEVAFRLGDSMAEEMLGKVLPVADGLGDPPRQADLLEKGLRVAAHFDRPQYVRAFVDRFVGLLESGGPKAASSLEPLLGQCFRGLRKLGLRDEVEGLLRAISKTILHGRDLTAPGPRSGPPAIEWARAIRLLLQVAAAWFDIGQGERSIPILDEARGMLFDGELIPIEQTSLSCAYLRSMALAPTEMALARMEEAFDRLERVHDSFTTNSHYSLTRLDVIEAAVLTLVSDDFTLDRSGRGRLEDDEYLVRRRVHRDVRAAMGTPE
jgi:FtsH ternary system domain X7